MPSLLSPGTCTPLLCVVGRADDTQREAGKVGESGGSAISAQYRAEWKHIHALLPGLYLALDLPRQFYADLQSETGPT